MVNCARIYHRGYIEALDTASASSGAAGRWLFLRLLICGLVFQMYHRSCQPLESSDGHIPGQPPRETWDAPPLGSCWDTVLYPASSSAFWGTSGTLVGIPLTWSEPRGAEADRAQGLAGCWARFSGSSSVGRDLPSRTSTLL